MNVYPLKCRIRNDAGGPTRVDVYDDIGEGGWFSDGLTAKDFSAQLSGVKGALEVHINSSGGDVWDGIAICNAVRAHKGPVTTVVDGLAASIASVIAQAGQDRVVQPGSMMMVHDASGSGYGVNAAEARELATLLDKVSDNLASIYADTAGGTAADWRAVMQAETWYTAEEAVTAGLASRIGDGSAELPAGLDVAAAFSSVPGRIAARLKSMPRAADGGDGDGDAPDCKTCGGSGRLKHPGTGKNGATCPSCKGSGTYDPDGGGEDDPEGGGPQDAAGDGTKDCPTCDGTGKIRSGHVECPDCEGTGKVPDGGGPDDRAPGRVAAARTPARVLGMESMPLADKALPVHHTATTDETWDGPAAVAAMPADDTVLKYCHAWESDEAAALPHREDDDDADDQKASYKFPHHKTDGGPANLAACRNGLARLSSADIPAGDDAGVKAHLQAHLDDAGGTGDHIHTDVSGAARLEQIRAALKGART